MRGSDIFPGKYLKADDLKGLTPTVTIDRVETEKVGDDSKPVIYFVGKERGVVLNRTNWTSIVELTGEDDSDNWHGKKIRLFVDPNVMYGGKRTPAIRIMAAQSAAPSKPKPAPVPSEDADDISPDADDLGF